MSNIDKKAKSVIRELIDDARSRRLGKLIITADEMGALLDELEAAEKRIAELSSAVIAPGIMRCAGCGFVLTKNSINMVVGTITAGDSKTEPCPNGCGPLWPVTWKEQAIEMRDSSEQWFEELLAARQRIAELEARAVKPVAWMRNANVTSFMSRFTTDEKYAVEQWGDDAVALYPIPVAFIPACFTDERNLMHINERGRETSLIWSKQNSDSGDIKLFRIAAAAGKGE